MLCTCVLLPSCYVLWLEKNRASIVCSTHTLTTPPPLPSHSRIVLAHTHLFPLLPSASTLSPTRWMQWIAVFRMPWVRSARRTHLLLRCVLRPIIEPFPACDTSVRKRDRQCTLCNARLNDIGNEKFFSLLHIFISGCDGIQSTESTAHLLRVLSFISAQI